MASAPPSKPGSSRNAHDDSFPPSVTCDSSGKAQNVHRIPCPYPTQTPEGPRTEVSPQDWANALWHRSDAPCGLAYYGIVPRGNTSHSSPIPTPSPPLPLPCLVRPSPILRPAPAAKTSGSCHFNAGSRKSHPPTDQIRIMSTSSYLESLVLFYLASPLQPG